MTKVKVYLFLFFSTIFLVGSFLGGWFLNKKLTEPKKIVEAEIITKVIYRKYKNLSREKLIEDLKLYDLGEPKLFISDIKIKGGIFDDKVLQFKNNASLSKREWSRDGKIEVAKSGNWKFYIGAGITAGVGAGLAILFK